jgi:ribosomal protein S24E
MKFFVNDVEVTEIEYNRIMREHELDVPVKFTMQGEVKYNEPKAAKQRKAVKVTTAPTATYTAGKKSKIDQAIEMVASMKGSSKERIVATLMVNLGNITKGNATIYYTKALAKGA